jgi:Excalibur calcium-binding domain
MESGSTHSDPAEAKGSNAMTGRLCGLRSVALTVVAALAGVALLPLGASAIQSDYDYDCTDFDSRADAQAFYEENGGPLYDPFNLDDDEDGQACEEWDRKYEQYANGANGSNGEDGIDKDCNDFRHQAEAQRYFEADGGSANENVDRLDPNHNGIACEHGEPG